MLPEQSADARKNSGCGTFGPGAQEWEASAGSWGRRGRKESGNLSFHIATFQEQEGHEMVKQTCG